LLLLCAYRVLLTGAGVGLHLWLPWFWHASEHLRDARRSGGVSRSWGGCGLQSSHQQPSFLFRAQWRHPLSGYLPASEAGTRGGNR